MSKKDKKKKKGKGKKSGDPRSKLKALQKEWKKATPKNFGKQAPDGDYEVKIVSAIVEEAKAESKRLQVLWGMKILEGDLKGRELTHRSGLEGESLSYFQGELETLELEIPDVLADIGDVLQDAIGLEVEVSLATRGEFQNLRFNELLEDSGDDDDDDDADDDDDDDDSSDDDDDSGDDDDEAYPTTAELKKMKKPALLKLIEEYELEVDTEDLTLKELRAAVIEASEEDEEGEGDEDDDDDDD